MGALTAMLLASVVAPAPAGAMWSASSGDGAAAGRATNMPRGLSPTASVAGSDVTVRWPAALMPDGTAVAGYVIVRYGANGQPSATVDACAGTIATTTCVEHNVPAGTWTYVDTPVQLSWTGSPSPAGAPVAVG